MNYEKIIQRQIKSMLKDSLAVIGLSWDRMTEKMLLNFGGSGHPIFRATSALERGDLRSK